MAEALVTVIVPVYKVEAYLSSCIESLQGQTHRNLQILLVDDGSPDGCGALCDQYAQEDPRIEVIHRTNGGVSAARNAGLEAAKGEYICFVDGDDLAAKNMVERALNVLESGPYDLCSWGMERRESGAVRYVGRRRGRRFSFLNERARARFFCRWFFTARTGWEVFSRMFRRSLIERHRLRFTDAFFAEDMDFTFRYLLHCRNFCTIPEPLYIYRVRGTSAMRTIVRQKQVEQFLHILQCQKAELKEELPLRLFCIYEAVALSIFMGEPEEGEAPQRRVRQMREALERCREWEPLLADMRSVTRDAGIRSVCGQPYRSLALAFSCFLSDGDEVCYVRQAKIYYQYLALRNSIQRLLHGKQG